MRNKLFFSFLAVVILALISSLIYEQFIIRDFEDYTNGTQQDSLYWIMASVEGSYADGKWDITLLQEAVRWAVMLGYDVKVMDIGNREVAGTDTVLGRLSPAMKRRLGSVIGPDRAEGEFETYPLYEGGRKLGSLLARKLNRPEVQRKEEIFRERGRFFLFVSFLIAGGGSVLLSVFFTLFFSRPLKKMSRAVEAMAAGDLTVRIEGLARDELGQLAERFNFMAEALEREDSLRKRLTSNIAHELRTPLAIMKASLEAMIDRVVEDQGQGLENIRVEVERLISLVSGIEDITRAEASFFAPMELIDIDLHAFLARMINSMAPLAAEKGLKLTLAQHSATPWQARVIADEGKLASIVRNILSNAIKYTEKGDIRLDYGINCGPECGNEKNRFFIEVRDTGSGIPEDKIHLVFRRFYRGNNSTGLGLGLAIVKELLNVMGGTIEVKSAEGEGSVFTIRLPVKQG
jgi:two-component system sensor histidine kinase BaeS